MSSQSCQHYGLCYSPSNNAVVAGYHRPPKDLLLKAAGKNNRTTVAEETFPAPLVLPDDDLASDPEYPAQSLEDWVHEEDRNDITEDRNTVYIVEPPLLRKDVNFMDDWSKPVIQVNGLVSQPSIDDIVAYLSAFYFGVPVKRLATPKLSFMSWDNDRARNSKTPRFVGLSTSSECIRIRTRPSRDNVYPRQLNLNDILDAVIEILPQDAYAILLIVPFDLYEDKNDDFCCGRAYGGSRVAVVSTARYQPVLDIIQKVERYHAWPASHCRTYIEDCCTTGRTAKKRKVTNSSPQAPSAICEAIAVHNSIPFDLPSCFSQLFLGRVCRTASHELGHCFGMDHCVYYACVMQGTASLLEDSRQPPYLCPVDAAKLDLATDTTLRRRLRALLNFCDEHENGHLFLAYAAWIRSVLAELEE